MPRSIAWFALVLSACSGAAVGRPAAPCPTAPVAPTMPAPAAATVEPAAPAISAERLAWWQTIRGGAPLPADQRADALLPELEVMLAATDPAVRDGIGYEVLARWLRTDGPLAAVAVIGLRDRLVARTAAAPTAGDAVFGRSFAALVLSVIAAREVAAPVWTDGELDAQVTAVAAYAARERDLRGHTGAGGWAHAAAHTADWMKFLARHPRLTAAQAERLLGATVELVARRHGARFSHGEDERLAAAVRAVARRGLVSDVQLDAWLARVAAPLGERWPDRFDPVLYAAQRNARDLLVSCVVALAFDDTPGAAAALARLRAFMAT